MKVQIEQGTTDWSEASEGPGAQRLAHDRMERLQAYADSHDMEDLEAIEGRRRSAGRARKDRLERMTTSDREPGYHRLVGGLAQSLEAGDLDAFDTRVQAGIEGEGATATLAAVAEAGCPMPAGAEGQGKRVVDAFVRCLAHGGDPGAEVAGAVARPVIAAAGAPSTDVARGVDDAIRTSTKGHRYGQEARAGDGMTALEVAVLEGPDVVGGAGRASSRFGPDPKALQAVLEEASWGRPYGAGGAGDRHRQQRALTGRMAAGSEGPGQPEWAGLEARVEDARAAALEPGWCMHIADNGAGTAERVAYYGVAALQGHAGAREAVVELAERTQGDRAVAEGVRSAHRLADVVEARQGAEALPERSGGSAGGAGRIRVLPRWGGRRLDGRRLAGVQALGADLREASLRGTDAHGANLRYALLEGADLRERRQGRGTDLREADLRGARVDGVRWGGKTTLDGSRWEGASIDGVRILDTPKVVGRINLAEGADSVLLYKTADGERWQCGGRAAASALELGKEIEGQRSGADGLSPTEALDVLARREAWPEHEHRLGRGLGGV